MTLQEIVSLLLFSWGGVALVKRYALTHGIVDTPSARSAHEQVTPRAGGLAFVLVFLSWCLAKALKMDQVLPVITIMLTFGAGALIALLGFLDDRFQLSALLRLLVQMIIAFFSSLIIATMMPTLWWGLPLAVTVPLWAMVLVASTNFYNFMDGSDGFATIQGLYFFGFLGALAHFYQHPVLAQMAWALSLTLVGFLYWNWPKAKIFMGDVGSSFLGFTSALLSVWLIAAHPLALWPLLVMYGPFWVDPLLTLVRRLYFKDNISTAHNQHAYQRLLRSSMYSKKRLLVGQIMMTTPLMALAIFMSIWPRYTIPSLLVALLLILWSYYQIEKKCPQKPYQGG